MMVSNRLVLIGQYPGSYIVSQAATSNAAKFNSSSLSTCSDLMTLSI